MRMLRALGSERGLTARIILHGCLIISVFTALFSLMLYFAAMPMTAATYDMYIVSQFLFILSLVIAAEGVICAAATFLYRK